MAAACLIATVTSRDVTDDPSLDDERASTPLANEGYDGFDESAYLNGAHREKLTFAPLHFLTPYVVSRRIQNNPTTGRHSQVRQGCQASDRPSYRQCGGCSELEKSNL